MKDWKAIKVSVIFLIVIGSFIFSRNELSALLSVDVLLLVVFGAFLDRLVVGLRKKQTE
ncbi:hypothetical protein [Ekhidna sp.]|uniref:hypothetical protein n=1 Tax=Ekhidna sp. TaxID=2608089 RepID=UPI0032972DFD